MADTINQIDTTHEPRHSSGKVLPDNEVQPSNLSPQIGQIVWNTTSNQPEIWNGSAWVALGGNAGDSWGFLQYQSNGTTAGNFLQFGAGLNTSNWNGSAASINNDNLLAAAPTATKKMLLIDVRVDLDIADFVADSVYFLSIISTWGGQSVNAFEFFTKTGVASSVWFHRNFLIDTTLFPLNVPLKLELFILNSTAQRVNAQKNDYMISISQI